MRKRPWHCLRYRQSDPGTLPAKSTSFFMALISFRECACAVRRPCQHGSGGFGQRNLFRVLQPAEVFPDPKILTSLMTQSGWTHFLHLIRLDAPLKCDFYAEMCRFERWSTRMLQKKIGGTLFAPTSLSKKPEKLAALEHKQLVAASSAEASACERRNILAV